MDLSKQTTGQQFRFAILFAIAMLFSAPQIYAQTIHHVPELTPDASLPLTGLLEADQIVDEPRALPQNIQNAFDVFRSKPKARVIPAKTIRDIFSESGSMQGILPSKQGILPDVKPDEVVPKTNPFSPGASPSLPSTNPLGAITDPASPKPDPQEILPPPPNTVDNPGQEENPAQAPPNLFLPGIDPSPRNPPMDTQATDPRLPPGAEFTPDPGSIPTDPPTPGNENSNIDEPRAEEPSDREPTLADPDLDTEIDPDIQELLEDEEDPQTAPPQGNIGRVYLPAKDPTEYAEPFETNYPQQPQPGYNPNQQLAGLPGPYGYNQPTAPYPPGYPSPYPPGYAPWPTPFPGFAGHGGCCPGNLCGCCPSCSSPAAQVGSDLLVADDSNASQPSGLSHGFGGRARGRFCGGIDLSQPRRRGLAADSRPGLARAGRRGAGFGRAGLDVAGLGTTGVGPALGQPVFEETGGDVVYNDVVGETCGPCDNLRLPFYLAVHGGGSNLNDLVTEGDGVQGNFLNDSGFLFGLAIGRVQGRNLRTELEVTYRTIDVTGLNLQGAGSQFVPVNGDLGTIAGMANIYWDFDIYALGPVRPYVGAGVGFAFARPDLSLPPGGTEFAVQDDQSSFAWQWMAGLSYRATNRLEVFAEYRFFVANSFELESDFTPIAGLGNGSGEFDFRSQNVLFGLRTRF